MADGPVNTEKVDWVLPIAQNVPLGSVPGSNLAKATEQHGIQLDVRVKDGQIVADVYKKVVEGMPAPKKLSTKLDK